MEFNEKLQLLRNQKQLTQEQLAEKLFVSRTAISKWESGKGYPNIESLKCISEFFAVSIDELLSSDELITLAKNENSSNVNKIYSMLLGVLDIFAIAFIFLPLYAKEYDGYIYSVNLFKGTENTSINRIIYLVLFIALIFIGTTKIIVTYLQKERLIGSLTKVSIVINILAVLFAAETPNPYVTAFLFMLFIIKLFLIIKLVKIK